MLGICGDAPAPDRLPWFVAGPWLGLLVVALYAVANKLLGATGAYCQVINLARDRVAAEIWRVWYFVGLFVGAAIAVALGSGFTLTTSYGAMGSACPWPSSSRCSPVAASYLATGRDGWGVVRLAMVCAEFPLCR